MERNAQTIPPALADHLCGMVLGLAVGDALGAPLEFLAPGSFIPVRDYQVGGLHGLQAGFWTDDTSMALASMISLLRMRKFDPQDQMHRFTRWWREGYLSSTGECFDIGNRTKAALRRFHETGEQFAGEESFDSAGNGALMRLAPVAVYAHQHAEADADQLAQDHARLTHADPRCIQANKIFMQMLLRALEQPEKTEVWQFAEADKSAFDIELQAVLDGSFLHKSPPQIRATGYVVATLEAALWAFANSASFEEGMLLAVNLGEDADTVGAVYGQLAGAYYGYSQIPLRWRTGLYQGDAIKRLTDALIYGNDCPKVGIPTSWNS